MRELCCWAAGQLGSWGAALWWPGPASWNAIGDFLAVNRQGAPTPQLPCSPPGADCCCGLPPSPLCSFAYVMMQRWLDAAKCFNFILTYVSK